MCAVSKLFEKNARALTFLAAALQSVHSFVQHEA